MDIYIIRNGAIVPYLKDGMRRNAQLPVLPPDVARIEITWMAEDDVVSIYSMLVFRRQYFHRSLSFCLSLLSARARARTLLLTSRFLACV
jgi:hypothetical protein